MLGHEVAAVAVAVCEASGGRGREMTKMLADGHGERPGGLEASAALRHIPAQKLGVPVCRDAEDPDLAVLDGGNLSGIDRPDDVQRGGDDLPLITALVPTAGAVGR